ncbi:hypothetical protein F5Y04DRAFT_277674 [Hypomontagnella monticulosa]|nr:hypothetical protein F5Y04DRAFT_277674 [Hypomontagnella monticulosa]
MEMGNAGTIWEWAQKLQVVLETCAYRFSGSSKTEMESLCGSLRIWILYNRALPRLDSGMTLDDRLKKYRNERSPPTMITDSFINLLRSMSIRVLKYCSQFDKISTDSIASALRLNNEASTALILGMLPPDEIQPPHQQLCIESIKGSLNVLNRLSSAVNSAYPEDDLVRENRRIINQRPTCDDQLDVLFTLDVIERQLRLHCPWVSDNARNSHATRIKSRFLRIFSILIDTQMPERIIQFLEHDIDDSELPILYTSRRNDEQIVFVKRIGDDGQRMSLCLQGWPRDDIRRFGLIQGLLPDNNGQRNPSYSATQYIARPLGAI